MSWQPIETATRDEDNDIPIDVWSSSRGRHTDVYWTKPWRSDTPDWCVWNDAAELMESVPNVTHWMPLPEPPE